MGVCKAPELQRAANNPTCGGTVSARRHKNLMCRSFRLRLARIPTTDRHVSRESVREDTSGPQACRPQRTQDTHLRVLLDSNADTLASGRMQDPYHLVASGGTVLKA